MASRDNNLRAECFRGPVSSVSSEGLSKRTHSRRPPIRMPIDRRRLLQAIAILGAICAYTTIVLGGTVRGMGAGLACPDWPLCYGPVVPGSAVPSHRGMSLLDEEMHHANCDESDQNERKPSRAMIGDETCEKPAGQDGQGERGLHRGEEDRNALGCRAPIDEAAPVEEK